VTHAANLAGRFAEVNAAATHLLNRTGYRVRVGPETLTDQNLCGRESHDANFWRQIDPQVFGLYGYAKADAQKTLPTDKVPANIRNIQLMREAYHRL
jgi:hypothetical protein